MLARSGAAGAAAAGRTVTVPFMLLMVAYTIVSLSVIAEPMVKFDIPEPVEQSQGR